METHCQPHQPEHQKSLKRRSLIRGLEQPGPEQDLGHHHKKDFVANAEPRFGLTEDREQGGKEQRALIVFGDRQGVTGAGHR